MRRWAYWPKPVRFAIAIAAYLPVYYWSAGEFLSATDGAIKAGVVGKVLALAAIQSGMIYNIWKHPAPTR